MISLVFYDIIRTLINLELLHIRFDIRLYERNIEKVVHLE